MATSSTNSVTPAQLAEQEKKASRFVDLSGGYLYALIVAFVLFAVGLALPHTGDVRGYEALLGLADAQSANIRLAERVFVILGTLAAVVFTGLTLITRRTVFANIAYILSGMSLFSSIFGMWMRIQSAEVEGATGLGIGIFLEVAAVIVLVYSYSIVIFRRSPEQLELARQRAAHENLDEVGYAQRSAMVTKQQDVTDHNPLLVDDRRRRASQRHQNNNE